MARTFLMPEMGYQPEMGVGEMPAEKIHDENGTFDVRVAWGQDSGYVQVSTQHNAGAQAIVTIVSDWLEAVGKPRIDWDELKKAAEAYTPGGVGFDGWHATLSRTGANQAIRALRRARDGAFGRDE